MLASTRSEVTELCYCDCSHFKRDDGAWEAVTILGKHRYVLFALLVSLQPGRMAMNWDCAQCSFSNHPDLPMCEMCEFQKPAPKGYIVSLPTKPAAHSSSDLTMSRSQYSTHSTGGNTANGCVEGLTELILAQGRGSDKLSYTVPAYEAALFNGDGRIPDIAQLQGWIERAWAAGFDVQGREQLGGRLQGSKTWIGTTECAALLRFFGIRAVIVDFPSTAPVAHPPVPSAGRAAGAKRDSSQLYPAQEEGGLRMTDRVCAWVQRYFTARCAPTSTAAVREAPLGADAAIASDDAAREAFAPPLYFQHQGHSRTIAGLHHTISSSGERQLLNLIVFNPSCDATIAQQSLLNGTQRWRTQLCRHASTFTEDAYQLVYIAPGIMSESERQRSKILIGMGEHNPFLAEL